MLHIIRLTIKYLDEIYRFLTIIPVYSTIGFQNKDAISLSSLGTHYVAMKQ